MNILTDFLTDIKAAWIVAGTSATTGTATFLDFIPDDIGKLATGIKHGIGVCGGKGHNGGICNISDPDGAHLRGRYAEHSRAGGPCGG